MVKLLLILMAFGALANSLASSQAEPPLLIDASAPSSSGSAE
jgi:hypothetical protein